MTTGYCKHQLVYINCEDTHNGPSNGRKNLRFWVMSSKLERPSSELKTGQTLMIKMGVLNNLKGLY
jgi:hypothetical protein